MKKKSALLTRSVSGFVLWSLLLLTLFKGQASAAKTEDLLESAAKAEPEKVRQLIQDGADVNAQNKDGWTPLMVAAYNNSNSETLMALIEAGAGINAKDKDGWTPLMVAAQYNPHLKALTALLEAGADVYVKGNDGGTPLLLAAIGNTPEVLTVLLEAGSDAKAKDGKGKTALDYAKENAKLKGTGALKLLEKKSGQR